ncbi:Hypothetical predicted protein [Paramuricea clavata]|uniref:Uncharacterized protein n=1 Tax=Paramuricea clavata TaxID=317549 RepID=A0A6S7GQN1_PARCT|nr:Hypothetical predicted protein [Paramuricea clavata]
MADETDQEGEWLDFSSSNFENEGKLFEPTKEEHQTEGFKEDLEHDTSVCSKLESVRELLQQSLPDTAYVRQKPSSPQCTPNSSAINESCKHWIWVKLISNLNAVRQAKWPGSCLEECYCRSLQISKDINEREQPQIAFDNSCRDFFNFHGILSTNQEPNRTNELVSTESDNELVNRNGTKHRDTMKSLDLTSTAKDELARSLDGDFEDLGAELEWSDNDVKDDTSLGNTSLSSSGINKNEATAELLCLPYHEILRLRDELKGYTKQYSDILVVELENRDAYIREKELKNDFISSFLSVQEKLRETTAAQNKKKFSLQLNNPPNSQVCI